MAKLIFKLNSVPDDEANEIKNLLSDNSIEYYESPPGNWGISLHGLWLRDEDQYDIAKQLIEEYQVKRSERFKLETSQKRENGELETFIQRVLNNPLQFIMSMAIIAIILYFTIMPFFGLGQD